MEENIDLEKNIENFLFIEQNNLQKRHDYQF